MNASIIVEYEPKVPRSCLFIALFFLRADVGHRPRMAGSL